MQEMPIPNLLVQFQCTAPSCSRMSSPLNILHLLPTVEEFMTPSSGSASGTTAVPFVTMRLKRSADQSCPFCRSSSRVVPVDPSFQSPELRAALRIMFGSFFGNVGPGIHESQHTQWEPIQAPGNEIGSTVGTRAQWVLVGDQVHQLLISTSPFVPVSQDPQQAQRQRQSTVQTSQSPAADELRAPASLGQNSPETSGEDDQGRFSSMFTMQQFLPWPEGETPGLDSLGDVPVLSPTAFPFEGLPEFQQEGQTLAFDQFSSVSSRNPATETLEQELSWAEVVRRGASRRPSDQPFE